MKLTRVGGSEGRFRKVSIRSDIDFTLQAGSIAISVSPPDHRPFGRSANNRPVPFDAIRRLDPNGSDAAGIDGQVVVERRRIEVAMDPAQIAEVGTATGKRIEASVGRCRIG